MDHASGTGIKWRRVSATIATICGVLSGVALASPLQTTAQSQYTYHLPVLMLSRPIAFESDRDGSYYHDLYLMHADGSGAIRIAGPDSVSCPSWSPDGRRLVYASMLSNDIYSIAADGSGLKALTTGSRLEDHPTWSPDGRYIAFAAADWPQSGIYAIRPEEPGEINLISSRSHYFWDPQWSSDGRQLAYSSNRDGNGDIYVADVITTTDSIRLLSFENPTRQGRL